MQINNEMKTSFRKKTHLSCQVKVKLCAFIQNLSKLTT